MLTSLKLTTWTSDTKRVWRYMSHTQASRRRRSKYGTAVGLTHVELDVVGEVEAPLGLHDVLEHREHVAVLAVELELDFRLVPLKIFRAHVGTSVRPARRPSDHGAGTSQSRFVA